MPCPAHRSFLACSRLECSRARRRWAFASASMRRPAELCRALPAPFPQYPLPRSVCSSAGRTGRSRTLGIAQLTPRAPVCPVAPVRSPALPPCRYAGAALLALALVVVKPVCVWLRAATRERSARPRFTLQVPGSMAQRVATAPPEQQAASSMQAWRMAQRRRPLVDLYLGRRRKRER